MPRGSLAQEIFQKKIIKCINVPLWNAVYLRKSHTKVEKFMSSKKPAFLIKKTYRSRKYNSGHKK